MSQSVPNKKALESDSLDEESKRKIRLIEEAHEFAKEELKLASTKNYTQFVQLDRPYVSYIVSAALQYELKPYLWKFPIVGELPYKGFFSVEDVKKEEEDLKRQNLDTYTRGVSAYSTLGYFKDPILSSMLRYPDHELVNLVIHETIHSTLYIKSSADFNERLAVFLGSKGAELFYIKKEGSASSTLQLIKNENADDKIFSEFLSAEIKNLEEWYKTLNTEDSKKSELKKTKLAELQNKFRKEVLPKLKTQSYKRFSDEPINNASLLALNTYVGDLTDFEMAYKKNDNDFHKALQYFISLEKTKEPEKALLDFTHL